MAKEWNRGGYVCSTTLSFSTKCSIMTVPAIIIFIILVLGTLVVLYVIDDLVFGKDYMAGWDRDVSHFVTSVLVGISGSLLVLIAHRILESFTQ